MDKVIIAILFIVNLLFIWTMGVWTGYSFRQIVENKKDRIKKKNPDENRFMSRKEGRRMTELKPCPFCGGEAEIKKNSSIGWFSIDEDGNFIEGDCGFVFCRNCRIRTEETDEAEAIEAWNMRAEK